MAEDRSKRRTKEAQEIDPELSLSAAEAKATHAMLDRLAARGNVSREAIEAYREHVIRHTIKTVH